MTVRVLKIQLQWLNPDNSHELLWDYSMCADTSRGAAIRDLIARALKGPLGPGQQEVRCSILLFVLYQLKLGIMIVSRNIYAPLILPYDFCILLNLLFQLGAGCCYGTKSFSTLLSRASIFICTYDVFIWYKPNLFAAFLSKLL